MKRIKSLLIIFSLITFNSISFAANDVVENPSDACDMTQKSESERCASQNPMETYLSIYGPDPSDRENMLDDSYNYLSDDSKLSAQAKVEANAELNKRISNLNERVMDSSFYLNLVFWIVMLSAIGFILKKIDTKTIFEDKKTTLITAFFLGFSILFLAVPSARYIIAEGLNLVVNKVGQITTNTYIDTFDETKSLKNIDDYKSVEEQVGGIDSKYSDSKFLTYALTDFTMSDDKELDYYLEKFPIRDGSINESVFVEKSSKRWEAAEELAKDLAYMTVDDVKITYAPYGGEMIDVNGKQVKFDTLTQEQKKEYGYISSLGFGAGDRYGKIEFAPTQITDNLFTSIVDIPKFLKDIRSGMDYKTASKEYLDEARSKLEFNGELDESGKDLLEKLNFGLGDLARYEMVAKQVLFLVESNSFDTVVNYINDYYCVDKQTLVESANNYINNPSLDNSGRLDCVGKKGDELVLLGADLNQEPYLLDTPKSTYDLRKQTTQLELITELKSITVLFDNMFNKFYTDYLANKQEIYDTATQNNLSRAKGLSGLGEFVLKQSLENGKSYYVSLKRPIKISINSDRYYISKKNLPESDVKEYEIDKLDRIDKKFVNTIIADFVQDPEYVDTAYQASMQNQYDNSIQMDKAYSKGLGIGFENSYAQIIKSLQNIINYDYESSDLNPIQNFYRFVNDLSDKSVSLGDEVFSIYWKTSAASIVSEMTNSAVKKSESKTKVKTTKKKKKEGKFKASKATNAVNEVLEKSNQLMEYVLIIISVLIFFTTILDMVIFWSMDFTVALWSISIFISVITFMNYLHYFPFFFAVGHDKKIKQKQLSLFAFTAFKPFYQMFEMYVILALFPFILNLTMATMGVFLMVFGLSLDGLDTNSFVTDAFKYFVYVFIIIAYFIFAIKFFVGIISDFIKKSFKGDDAIETDMKAAIDAQNFAESLTYSQVGQKFDEGFKFSQQTNATRNAIKRKLSDKIYGR
ncbi:hypothetical protein [Vibrio furnissii]|uniref:hypothetical protein n=1 Tax=Vibrio furnissii TaxID=29494 RepID=UPI001EEBA20F|nr:hypothetical protein [Vibrio furnissii]MCG6268627.1 hypothetical protein [Vibrio furnissii]